MYSDLLTKLIYNLSQVFTVPDVQVLVHENLNSPLNTFRGINNKSIRQRKNKILIDQKKKYLSHQNTISGILPSPVFSQSQTQCSLHPGDVMIQCSSTKILIMC